MFPGKSCPSASSSAPRPPPARACGRNHRRVSVSVGEDEENSVGYYGYSGEIEIAGDPLRDQVGFAVARFHREGHQAAIYYFSVAVF